MLKIVEPTLRVAIAFLHLILFQLSGAEAQEKRRRAGDAGPGMRSATAQTARRWWWCRQANS